MRDDAAGDARPATQRRPPALAEPRGEHRGLGTGRRRGALRGTGAGPLPDQARPGARVQAGPGRVESERGRAAARGPPGGAGRWRRRRAAGPGQGRRVPARAGLRPLRAVRDRPLPALPRGPRRGGRPLPAGDHPARLPRVPRPRGRGVEVDRRRRDRGAARAGRRAASSSASTASTTAPATPPPGATPSSPASPPPTPPRGSTPPVGASPTSASRRRSSSRPSTASTPASTTCSPSASRSSAAAREHPPARLQPDPGLARRCRLPALLPAAVRARGGGRRRGRAPDVRRRRRCGRRSPSTGAGSWRTTSPPCGGSAGRSRAAPPIGGISSPRSRPAAPPPSYPASAGASARLSRSAADHPLQALLAEVRVERQGQLGAGDAARSAAGSARRDRRR